MMRLARSSPSASSVVSSAWLWALVALAATTITMTTKIIGTEAWTSSLSTTRALYHKSVATTTPSGGDDARAGSRTPTVLFGKKKKKKGGGGGGAGSATKGAAKIQVKLLQHIAGTGQAGDVVLVNPVFFANKLRPQKLARVIADDEVRADLEEKQTRSDELLADARALKNLLDGSDGEGDGDGEAYELVFRDNQTGPDGKKLFGGIGPKKLLESLRGGCPEFEAFSKRFTKQVSILDVEEEELVAAEASAKGAKESKYKDYSSYAPSGGGSSNDSDEPKAFVTNYSSLPKKDKLTIKTTGIFRMKVALTKDLFARVRIVVE